MRFLSSFVVLGAGLMYAQAQQPSQAEIEQMKAAAEAAIKQAQPKPAESQPQEAKPAAAAAAEPPTIRVDLMNMLPSAVVATVDGEQVTAGTLRAIIANIAPQMQQQALQNPRQLLEQYAIMRRLAREAEEANLDKQTPVKESLEAARMQILAQAGMGHRIDSLPVTEEEVAARYEASKAEFTQARVKAIYLPFGEASPQADPKEPKPMTEAEAKAKADSLVKEARAGADFVKLVKEHSKDPNSVAKDGDFGLISRSAPIPAEAKNNIFGAKAGEITDPVRMPNGYYIFRIEEMVTPPLDQVRSTLTQQVRSIKFGDWIRAQQATVKIEEATSPAAPQPQPPAPGAK